MARRERTTRLGLGSPLCFFWDRGRLDRKDVKRRVAGVGEGKRVNPEREGVWSSVQSRELGGKRSPTTDKWRHRELLHRSCLFYMS